MISFRTGLFSAENESKQWYAMIQNRDINISAQNLQNRAHFSEPVENESKQWYATIKTYKNINISAQYQYFCTKPSEQGSFF